jgi:hypothetical protein
VPNLTKAAAYSCYDANDNPNLRCRLTNVGPAIGALRRFVTRSAPGCTAVKERLVGVSRAGGVLFEVACRNGDGYLAHRTESGALDTLTACRDAALGGACRLSGKSRT